MERQERAFRRFFINKGLTPNSALWNSYQIWKDRTSSEDFERFHQCFQTEYREIKAGMEAWPNPFVNAKKGEYYKVQFRLPENVISHSFHGLEEIGIKEEVHLEDPSLCEVSGIPLCAGTYTFCLVCILKGSLSKKLQLKRQFSLLVNPDPKDLWEDIPSDQAQEYGRPDLEFAKLICEPAMLWGASRRGRSHAHAGKPRDDAFTLACHNGWKMLAVSDGAGSAEFSRKGAELACAASLAFCKEKLPENGDLERIFQELDSNPDPGAWKADCLKLAYHILPAAAFEAHKAIRQEAEAKGRETRAYAATLLLALAKKFPGGWAVLSFQVGDGAMGLFAGAKWDLLAQPDEGEYGGQTRFITMNEIFDSSQELMRRLRVDFVPDLRGLLLMSDGVSDAWFQTGEGLHDNVQWQKLWGELSEAAMGAEPEAALLDWLNFWSRGNHDDRTVALLAVES